MKDGCSGARYPHKYEFDRIYDRASIEKKKQNLILVVSMS